MKRTIKLLTALLLAPLAALHATEQVHHRPGALSRLILPVR
jgi:hypothetical protein